MSGGEYMGYMGGLEYVTSKEEQDKFWAAGSTQIGGSHYNRMKIQPTEFIMANGLGFCEGNIIKYVCRYQFKNGKEDLLKARHYIDILLATKYPE